MKLTLRLVTNKPVKIDLDFVKYGNQIVSTMSAVEHTEKVVVFLLDGYPSMYTKTTMSKVKKAINEVIAKEYPNMSIKPECLTDLDNLLKG